MYVYMSIYTLVFMYTCMHFFLILLYCDHHRLLVHHHRGFLLEGYLLEGYLLVQDLIISCLNYWSSLLTGLPTSSLAPSQILPP